MIIMTMTIITINHKYNHNHDHNHNNDEYNSDDNRILIIRLWKNLDISLSLSVFFPYF